MPECVDYCFVLSPPTVNVAWMRRTNVHTSIVQNVVQILPIAIRNVLEEGVRVAIIKMSRVFQRLCAKEVKVEDESDMLRDVVMATCVMEKEFPPNFLNVMTHLPVHLVQQLFTCGPVHCRWMYPIERYMKTLKDYVRTLAHPEGSIAEGYTMEETLGFCTEYMRNYEGTTHRVWDPDEEPVMNDEILRNNCQRRKNMSREFRNHAHAFVLDNAGCLQPFREQYAEARGRRWQDREAFRRQYRRQRGPIPVRYPLALADLPSFALWFTSRITELQDAGEYVEEDVLQYTQPPERSATTHRHMYAYGMHLRVRSAELGLVTRDSCVVASFTRQERWGLRNGRPVERVDDYVGYITEILELDYRSHCTTVLVCDWVRPSTDPRYPSIMKDKYGFTLANFHRMDGKVHADSFAFPLHCQQVFFSDDTHQRGWKIVCPIEVRGRRGLLQSTACMSTFVAVGNDDEFVGLQPTILELDPERDVEEDGGVFIPQVVEEERTTFPTEADNAES